MVAFRPVAGSACPIGGYFQCELGNGAGYNRGDLLNSGRSCFEFVLRAGRATHVFLPLYTCDAMIEPVRRAGATHSFYRIDERLEMRDELEPQPGEFVVYNNYAGIKDGHTRELASRYGHRLILDCSQAYFFGGVPGSHTFFSPRKFFGVPDGGCLLTDLHLDGELPIDVSFDRVGHLFKRIDLGPEAGYADFRAAEDRLGHEPIKEMSRVNVGHAGGHRRGGGEEGPDGELCCSPRAAGRPT